MANTFETGAVLVLKDDFSTTFARFTAGIEGADAQTKALLKNIGKLGSAVILFKFFYYMIPHYNSMIECVS